MEIFDKNFEKWYENVQEIIDTNENSVFKYSPFDNDEEVNDINIAKKTYQRELSNDYANFYIMSTCSKDKVREVYNKFREEIKSLETDYGLDRYAYTPDPTEISVEREKEIAKEIIKQVEKQDNSRKIKLR